MVIGCFRPEADGSIVSRYLTDLVEKVGLGFRGEKVGA